MAGSPSRLGRSSNKRRKFTISRCSGEGSISSRTFHPPSAHDEPLALGRFIVHCQAGGTPSSGTLLEVHYSDSNTTPISTAGVYYEERRDYGKERVEALKKKLEGRANFGATDVFVVRTGVTDKKPPSVSESPPTKLTIAVLPLVSPGIPSVPTTSLGLTKLGKTASHIGFELSVSVTEMHDIGQASALVELVVPLSGMKLKRVTSEILWVCDGVAVHRETFEIDGCIGLKVLVSAQGFKTDLSGLRLIKSENLLSRRAELQKSLVARLDEVWHQTRGEGVDVTHRERNVNTTILGVAGTVASAWLLPPAFLAAAPTALALAACGLTPKI